MKFLVRIDGGIARLENFLLLLLLSIMILFAFFQIPLAKIYPIHVQGIETLLRQLVLWVGFLGATLATRDNRHISIDLLSRVLKGRLKILGEILTHCFAALICALLLLATIRVIMDSRSFGETISIFIDVPTWTIQSIFIFGFGLMVFRHALKGAEKVLELAQGGQTP